MKPACLAIFLLIMPVSFALNAVTPCQRYQCFDISSPNFECSDGLVVTRGWCPGPNNIRMCGPPGVPIGPMLRTAEGHRMKEAIAGGKYVNCGPAKLEEVSDVQPVRDAKPKIANQDFKVIIDGDVSCSYKVENNGKVTRDWTPVECDSEVVIELGQGKDCAESGECIVWSDGGIFGTAHRVGTFQVAVTPCKSPREGFTCMSTGLCKLKGGKSVPKLCPGSVDNQCCVFGETEGTNLFDIANILTNDDAVQKILSDVQAKKNSIIIIETVDSIGSSAASFASKKFSEHSLDTLGTPAFNIYVAYGRKENKFVIGYVGKCGLLRDEVEKAVNTNDVKQLIQKSNYNNAFMVLAKSLSDVTNSKNTANIKCDYQSSECSSCGSGVIGWLTGCMKSACEKLGCEFNSKYELCTDVSSYETSFTIAERLEAVKNSFKGFIRKDPLCSGANCAQYVSRAHEYIFGIGKGFITGVSGNAWEYPENIKEHGGTVKLFDWRKGEIFRDYDSLLPGDILGLYYSDSNYRSDKPAGRALGNTPDIDFTHALLYLGKRGNEHIVTHLYHTKNADEVRIESIESFFREYGSKFKVRAVMRPDQEKLYRVIDKNSIPQLGTAKISEGEDLAGVIGMLSFNKEEYMWLTADINNLVVNKPNLDKYAGSTVYIPKNLPEKYAHEYPSVSAANAAENEQLIAKLEKVIKNKYPQMSDARAWAEAIVKNAKYKNFEYVSLIASFIDHETGYYQKAGLLQLGPGGFVENLKYKLLGGNPTLGCMQIRLCKLGNVAKKSGKSLDQVGSEIVSGINGCAFYGEKYVEEIISIYTPSGKFDDTTLMIVSGDFSAGPYSGRNAAFQQQLNDIMGTGLDTDGDLLAYDKLIKSCPPVPKPIGSSETELTLKAFIDSNMLQITSEQLRAMLVLEKTSEFEKTQIYKEVKKAWKGKFGRDPPYAIIPKAAYYTGAGDSLGYARAIQVSYNDYCKTLGCSTPSAILADANSVALAQPIA